MTTVAIASNPFALMMYPEHVREAMRNSTSLRSLRGQEFHPLDKPAPSVSASPEDEADEDIDLLPDDDIDDIDDDFGSISEYGLN